MPSVWFDYTQGVWGYQVDSTGSRESGGCRCLVVSLSLASRHYPECGSTEVPAYPERVREIHALPAGRCPVLLRVAVSKDYCLGCGHVWREHPAFTSSPTSRITRQLERTVVELCHDMPMKAIADHFGLGQGTVRDRHDFIKVAVAVGLVPFLHETPRGIVFVAGRDAARSGRDELVRIREPERPPHHSVTGKFHTNSIRASCLSTQRYIR